GGGSGQRQGSVVGSPCHTYLSGGPEGFYFFATHPFGIALRSSAKPVNDCFWCKRFIISTYGGGTIRQSGSRGRGMDNNIAAGHPGFDMGIGNNRPCSCSGYLGTYPWARRVSQLMLDVPKETFDIGCHTGIVRTGLINYRKLEPFGFRLFRTGHSNMHPIRSAVSIRIKGSLYP